MPTFLRPKFVAMIGRPAKVFSEDAAHRMRLRREQKTAERIEHMAVLDFETDPFDHNNPDFKIAPFAACLFGDNFPSKILWENDADLFIDKLVLMLDELKTPHLIYAHNGGKFDFMFLMKKLRGKTSFKGRGIMSAKIGIHELRDSLHLIPEKLKNFRKDDFDYTWMIRGKRDRYKAEIVHYLENDCRYLHDLVKSFLTQFGVKISIGQAAMTELKKHYTVKTIGENTDARLREFFFGGRVECLAGAGHFIGKYRMYDVNSMYPFVMANFLHPISDCYSWRRNGGVTDSTCFIDLSCENDGALVKRGSNNETSATVKRGRFLTTIWEYKTAIELGLIADIKIHNYVDNLEFSNFSKFILPIYAKRQVAKEQLDAMNETHPDYFEVKKESTFLKLVMNNAYGKFAQNPRRFKESFITDAGDPAPKGFENSLVPVFRGNEYDIWERPTPHFRFNNVGTAASITGAARSVLLRAKHAAVEPIYCDTDSLICKELVGVSIDASALGSWKFEKEFDEVIIAGKKLYATKSYGENGKKDVINIKSKGAQSGGLKWKDMLDLLDGKTISVASTAPTLTKTGKQYYMTRSIKATAPRRK